MRILINLIVTALIVFLLSNFLPGVSVDGFGASVIVVIVMAILNIFVKPILQIISIPITILTLGLFLFVINAFIIWLCSVLVRSEEHTSELQSRPHLVCRLLLEKKN